MGKVSRPHGIRGELRVIEGLGSSGAWHRVEEVFIGRGQDDAVAHRIRGLRVSGKHVIVSLEGVADRDAADRLKGLSVYVPRESLATCGQDEYYAEDLIGLQVVDVRGRVLGLLVEIFDNGAHEVYAVREGSQQVLLPVVDGVVKSVDLELGRMIVDPPEGLPGTGRDG
ncbi:MAG: 16S rRNA processing protein RimM [Deltaproteobacteria bacterium]|nr:16S rRNA processing protein RimM [Deltaproteobacteria bacterium]